jgi:hypothetical protein
MLFPAMVWVATTGGGPLFRAKAEKLVYGGAQHAQFQMDRLQSFVTDAVGLSQSDGPWGEPPLTEDSAPLRRTTSPENQSSMQSVEHVDMRMTYALWQRLSTNIDDTTVLVEAGGVELNDEPSPLRPVVFTLRQSRGGRTVRPESVLELNDTDKVRQTGPGTPSMVVVDKCLWQCADKVQ